MESNKKIYVESNTERYVKRSKPCSECKDKPARHWSKELCEDCFGEMLREKA
ncbi:hypothetical protein SAMN05216232_1967 [Virgibacillus subterraneus]|uniref:Uncharacterized protein n=1 Tax=Virgibacillus subterraneus TaxID=621109 RepID=A0A1H9ECG2_9BACI|nr:hypothetical protein SAMN05216232_1967 [Virgibacillus subterraneus]